MKLVDVGSGGAVGPPVDPREQLRAKAQEFEGLLLAKMLEKLKDAYGVPGGEENDPSAGSMEALATSALGGGLARRGGIGIARMIVESLSSQAAVNNNPEVLNSNDIRIKAFS